MDQQDVAEEVAALRIFLAKVRSRLRLARSQPYFVPHQNLPAKSDKDLVAGTLSSATLSQL